MNKVRNTIAFLIVSVMKITGFRFSKHYRWGTTFRHRLVYTFVNVVAANIKAGV